MRGVRLAVLIAGGAAVIGQALAVREGLELFSGNELALGLMIGVWICGAGLGSLLIGRTRGTADPARLFAGRVWLLICALVFCVGFLRFAPLILRLPFGEVIPLERMFLICVVAILPCGLAVGSLFPAAARLLAPQEAYLLEGIGSFLGGLAGSLVLVPFLPSLGILLVIVILLIAALGLALGRRRAVFLVILPLLPLPAAGRLELGLRRLAVEGRDLVSIVETRYGRSSVFRAGRQFDFYTGGVYDFTYPDAYRAEAAVHYPMLLHPDPKRVLLLGGSLTGARSEILKYPSVSGLVCVELDPRFYRWAAKFTAGEGGAAERLRVIFIDARAYVMETDDRFDVIIVNLPDPVNGQLNRYYTREFFGETKRILADGGILSVGVSAPPDIIGPEYAEYLRAVRSGLARSYARVLDLPADRLLFIASERGLDEDGIADTLILRIDRRGIKTLYVRGEYIKSNLDPERLAYYRRILDAAPVRANRDLNPICYYYAMTLWGGMGPGPVRRVLTGLSRLPAWLLFLPLLSVLFFYRRRSLIYVSVAAQGAVSMAVEIALLMLFQLRYGYVYAGVAALVAAFMAGLSFGAWRQARRPSVRSIPVRRLSLICLVNSAVAGVVLLAMLIRLPFLAAVILILLGCAGMINGLYFTAVLQAVDPGRAGLAYGLDLLGSFLAAFGVSVVLIPLAGVPATLLGSLALVLLVAAGLRTVK